MPSLQDLNLVINSGKISEIPKIAPKFKPCFSQTAGFDSFNQVGLKPGLAKQKPGTKI